jgi:hypothetical protein
MVLMESTATHVLIMIQDSIEQKQRKEDGLTDTEYEDDFSCEAVSAAVEEIEHKKQNDLNKPLLGSSIHAVNNYNTMN